MGRKEEILRDNLYCPAPGRHSSTEVAPKNACAEMLWLCQHSLQVLSSWNKCKISTNILYKFSLPMFKPITYLRSLHFFQLPVDIEGKFPSGWRFVVFLGGVNSKF